MKYNRYTRYTWSHPLRATWRKNTGEDNLKSMLWATLVALGFIIFGHVFVWIGGVPRTDVFVFKAGTYVLALFTWLGLMMVSSDQAENKTFRHALKRLKELIGEFGVDDAYSSNGYYLWSKAEVRLRALARHLIEAENAVGTNPHNNNLYVAREQARLAFIIAHDLLWKFDLADEKWDRYFRADL